MNSQDFSTQIAEIRDKLRSELHEELEKLFKKEKDNLLERAQLFMNVTKWSAAAIAVTFGLLGIKAWSDVKTNVEEYFRAKLEKAYRIDDTASPLRREIDELMDRALLNALYVQVQRERDAANSQRRGFRRESDSEGLSSGELDRLVRMVKSPQTASSMFADAVSILHTLLKTEDRRQAVSSAMAELLAARPNSQTEWMLSSEKKRLAILSIFRNSEAVDAIASELLFQPTSDRVKRAALARIEKEDYKGAIPSILKFIDTTEEQRMKFDGLRVLARLRPEHERIRVFVSTVLLKATEKTDLLRCLEMAAVLAASGKRETFLDDDDDRQRHKRVIAELAVPLAARAFDAGVHMNYQDFGFQEGLRARVAIGPSSFRVVRIAREFYSDGDFMPELLDRASSNSLGVLARYLAALSLDAGSRSRVKDRVRATASLRADSRLQFEDGTEITVANVKGAVVELTPDAGISSETKPGVSGVRAQAKGDEGKKVLATWEDMNGARFRKHVSAIKNVTFGVSARFGKEPEELSEDF